MSLPAAASGAEPGTAADATVVSRSQAGHAELPTVTVTAAPEATGTAEQGYREDRVSQVGPWEGRNLQDTPYSITVFSEELIRNLQAVSPDQVFRIDPTMQLSRSQYENNQPTINLRGFNFYTAYRDGVPDDQYGHAMSMEDTQRIEVLNGLSGFLYGSGNVGGIVNFVTKRSTDERLNAITLSSLGNESWGLHGDFGGKFDAEGRFGYRVNIAEQRGDTAIRGQRIEKSFYSVVLDWKPLDNLTFWVSGMKRHYDVYGAQAAWSATAATRVPASAIRNDRSYGPSWTNRFYDADRYSANFKWDLNRSVSLRGTYLTSRSTRNSAASPVTNTIVSSTSYSQSISGVYAPGVVPDLSYQDDVRSAAYADFSFETGPVGHKVTTGFQYSDTSQDWWTQSGPRINTGTFRFDDPQYVDRPTVSVTSRGERVPRFRTRRQNLIVGDDIQLSERWSVLAGVAYTTIASRTSNYDDSALTPTLSLIFKPTVDLTTYLSYMEALEQGATAADEYQGVPVVNQGQAFKPLTSRQVELGAKYSLGGVLLSGALFKIDKGLQYYDLDTPGQARYVQDGRQVHQGLEFTAIGKVTQNLSILAGYTWLDAKIRKQRENPALEGKHPVVVADQLFKIRAEYAIPAVRNLSVSGSFTHVGNSYADNRNTDKLPAYRIFDLGTRYELGTTRNPVTLRLDVLNVADKHYWANATALGEPRTVMLSVSTRL